MFDFLKSYFSVLVYTVLAVNHLSGYHILGSLFLRAYLNVKESGFTMSSNTIQGDMWKSSCKACKDIHVEL